MNPEIRDAITDWTGGYRPAPEGLQQEMIDEGFPQLTPDIVRRYLTEEHSTLSLSQLADCSRWLGV